MKKLPITLLLVALMALVACKEPASKETTIVEEIEEKIASEAPDYAAFDEKVAVIRSLFQAHSDEDIDKLRGLLADTLKWSPPYYNGNKYLGKDDYLAALKQYQDEFENIKYSEGIIMPDTIGAGHWSGSVYPQDGASTAPSSIRIYGTWTAKHTATGKDVGVKWYGIGWINDDGKIVMMTEYFDAHGIAAQVSAE